MLPNNQCLIRVDTGDWGYDESFYTKQNNPPLPKVREELAKYERWDTSIPWREITFKWKSESRFRSSVARGTWLRHEQRK